MSELLGAITDVAGVRVGHVTRIGDGWLTGVTVVLPPPGTRGAVDVRGGAPATHETDALAVDAVSPYPDAVLLAGGSAYGLQAVAGVQRWCEEQGRGVVVGPGLVVPVVPAVAIFDLGRGGDPSARPTPEMGYAAAQAAHASGDHAPVDRGTVGAGTGATIRDERAKGGVGTASLRVPLGPGRAGVVGALAVVNAFGRPLTGAGDEPLPTSAPDRNTVLVVVATDVALPAGQLVRLASAGHDGLARAVEPVHTLADGDVVLALGTGAELLPGAGPDGDALRDRARRDAVMRVQAGAARVVRDAVLDAVRSATGVRTPVLHLPPHPATGGPVGLPAPEGRP